MRAQTSIARRALLGVFAAAAGPAAARALEAKPSKEEPPIGPPSRIIDFHNHHVTSSFKARAGAGAPPAMRAYFQSVNDKLADARALLSSIDSAGISARVVNTPLEFIRGPDSELPQDAVRRINDDLAELVSRHPDRLYGLATVDAYAGDSAAREIERAVRDLGLRGVFVESAKGELLLDAEQAQPTLNTAAALGVPVFAHPITDPELRRRLGRYGRGGTMLNRATVNAATLFALLESGTFDRIPGLRIVVTTLALGGVLLAGGFGGGLGIRRDAPEVARKHVYIDTMGLHPALMRAAVDLLGVDHVLVGTDWPIFVEEAIPGRLLRASASCGLTETEQEMIASGNTMRLLQINR